MAICGRCGRVVGLTDQGVLVAHVNTLAPPVKRGRSNRANRKQRRCAGSGQAPRRVEP